MNLNVILKSSTDVALAYIRSPLFKASLQVCNTFKLCTDITRYNEPKGKDPSFAGPNFIKDFINETKNYEGIEKVKTMVFCGDSKKA